MRTRRPSSSMIDMPGHAVADPAPRRPSRCGVDGVNDLQVARQHPLQQPHRPGLERLWHHRVVGVGERRGRDIPCLSPGNFVNVDEKAHQLGDGDRGMRVVELNCGIIRQRAHIAMLMEVPAQQVLQRGGRKEILLRRRSSCPAGVSSLG